ncbi:MAG TPA: class I SAM-dependent methyltransferase [Acidimicrobiales bacterium]|nr:class I SAM-dependent methyltransferase [Acidimicrobiales bacterium]
MQGSIARNRATWNAMAHHWVGPGERSWATDEVTWGVFSIPESDVRVLPDVRGRDVVELGCGTGYVSAWLARRGARRVVGIDPTEGQLATARRLQGEVGPAFPLVQGAGEDVPLAAGCCDLVVSEYGAALWADPRRWLPEAARLLRPGGELVFLTGSVLHTLCAPDEGPAGPTLVRSHRDLHEVDYPDDESIEYHVGHGEMIRLLRASGFEVLDLVEMHAPESAPDSTLLSGDSEYLHVPAEWAHRWPVEEIWRARRP